MPQQSFDLVAGRVVFEHRVFVSRIELPHVVILYALDLLQTPRVQHCVCTVNLRAQYTKHGRRIGADW